MVKCQVVMDAMEKLAPRRLAEIWDNPGLLVGSPGQEIHRILVCLDVRPEIAQRAVREKFDLIVAHHPLIFHPLKKIRTDLPEGRLLTVLLQGSVAVLAAHTNLDIAAGGVNDVLAERIGLDHLEPFKVTAQGELVKLAVYVPLKQAEAVRSAITAAGAGHIGRYSDCTFQVVGQGTFLPEEGTNPFIGEAGRLARVDEVRIETIFPVEREGRVLQAMKKAHPYEEPAYDLYSLRNPGREESLGRVGYLSAPLPVEDFAAEVKARIGADYVRLVRAGDRAVRKVALCSGSGAEFIEKAAILGCDAYVTGDVRYHDAQRAAALGMHVIDAGHFATEQIVVPVLARYLSEALAKAKGGVEVVADDQARDFFTLIT